MKNWIKKQFPTKRLFWKTFVIAYPAYVVSMGAIKVYQSTYDNYVYAEVGIWMMFFALIWVFLMHVMSHSMDTSKLYNRLLDNYEEMTTDMISKIRALHKERYALKEELLKYKTMSEENNVTAAPVEETPVVETPEAETPTTEETPA